MDLGIAGKVAFVAASTSGLGRASAVALAAEGVHVCVTGRRAEALDEVVSEIREAGGTAVSTQLDVEDVNSVEQALDLCERELGPVDILVFNSEALACIIAEKIRIRMYRGSNASRTSSASGSKSYSGSASLAPGSATPSTTSRGNIRITCGSWETMVRKRV